ncbi:MAG TPA: hypothetical protein VFV30_08975, partial [Novosphingobium sp.]|nr:hypothetical protein [Novosphingobium sp.]
GTIQPEVAIPGGAAADGVVSYVWGRGWAGEAKASGTPFKGATADIAFGFAETAGVLGFYGTGGISCKIRDADLTLKAGWKGAGVSYKGGVKIKKPLPLVDEVDFNGSYGDGLLHLGGSGNLSVAGFTGRMQVNYDQKDGEDGTFSGSAHIQKKGMLGGKADADFKLNYSKEGKLSGSGILAYQVTPAFRPELGVHLLEDGRIKVKGSVTVTNFQVFKAWPGPGKDRRSILKGGISIGIPIPPFPVVQATLSVTGELGVAFGVGPGLINGTLTAELFPFEEDKKIKATLDGKFTVPAKAELYGRFGALLGVAIAGGLAGVEGGIYLKPAIGVKGEGGIGVKAEYADGGFSFEANAFATGAMYGSLGIDFAAAVYLARNLLRYEWTHPLAKYGPVQLGPTLDVQLGKIAYARDGTVTWPDPSQISITPKEFDPLQLVADVLKGSKMSPEP